MLTTLSDLNSFTATTGTLRKFWASPARMYDWRKAAFSKEGFALEAHPDIVLSENEALDGDKYFTCSWIRSHGQSEATLLLKKKSIRLPLLFGRTCLPDLRGLRVIGNQFLGSIDCLKQDEINIGIAELLQQQEFPCDAILLEALHFESPLYSSLIANNPSDLFEVIQLGKSQRHHRLQLPIDEEKYWSKFSPKTRYNFRRMCKRLPHDIEFIESPSHVCTFLQDANEISQKSWQFKHLGTRIQHNSKTQTYFESIARLGALRCYLLKHDGSPIAFVIGTQWQGHFQVEEMGYDNGFAKSSPGTVLFIRLLKDLFKRNRPSYINFGFGDGKYKQLFGNESSHSVNLLLCSKKLKVRLATNLYQWNSRIESNVRKTLQRTGLTEKLRQLYRS